MSLRRVLVGLSALAVLWWLFNPGDLIEVEPSAAALPNLPFEAKVDGSGFVTAVGDIADCDRDDLWNRVVSVFDYRLSWAGIQVHVPAEAARLAKMVEQQPGLVLALGDLTYPTGEPIDFAECFGRTWANLLPRVYPVPGNHEYKTAAIGYREFWGPRAGPEGFYYSVDYSGWHLVALNSEIDGGPGSRQAEWLEADLQQHRGKCVLAFDHRPAFSSRLRNGNENALALFRILYEHNATLLLSGHNHFYERTAPVDPSGARDPRRGVRQFVVGTGGADLNDVPFPKAAFSEDLITDRRGALQLALNATGYEWRFLDIEGNVVDRGEGACATRTQTAGSSAGRIL